MNFDALERRISVAPMMDRSDRPFRLLIRKLSRRSVVYTEMVTTRALLSDKGSPYQQEVDPREHPVALQLGGDDPASLGQCARLGEELGYDEINLNVGCPSSRVQHGRIGAILMRDPERVADCVAQMRARCKIPVSVKHRLGVDKDPDEALERFVDIVAQSGVDFFTVHARKAWLQGLSPKENRDIPPLRYELVHRLATRRPNLRIELNGGIQNLAQCQDQLCKVHSVMLGRAVWDHPMLLARVDSEIYGLPDPAPSRAEIACEMLPTLENTLRLGRAWSHALRPLLNLYHGQTGGRRWRRTLSEGAARKQDPTLRALVQRALVEQCENSAC